MKKIEENLRLYAITDRRWCEQNDITIYQQVEEAILGGATIIQIREKNISNNELLEEVLKIKEITSKYKIPLIVNDNIEVAIKSDADGIHLGQEDLINIELKEIRKKFEKISKKIIGISANNLQEAVKAEKEGADYLGINTPFSTHSVKTNSKTMTLQQMKEITNFVKIPCVAIGGIRKDNIRLLSGLNIKGVCVITAIFYKKNVKELTKNISKEIEKYLNI